MYRDRKSLAPAGWLLVAVVIAGCERSEQVGWSDRNPPSEDSPAAVQGSEEGVPTDSPPSRAGPPLPDTARQLMIEYQGLAAQLEPVRVRAMEDSAIQSHWAELNADVEDRMIAENPFVARLLGRAEEIEERFAEAEEGGEALSPEEQSRLGRQWQDIQQSLGQARSQVLQDPEFTRRLQAFQSALYERMRAIAPEQRSRIDRLERLGDEIVSLLDSLAAAGRDTAQTATP